MQLTDKQVRGLVNSQENGEICFEEVQSIHAVLCELSSDNIFNESDHENPV